MKTLTTATALILSLGAASVNAADYTAADNSLESNLCVTAAIGTKIQLHDKVSDFRPTAMASANYKLIANNLYCNGVSIAEFAAEAGNNAVAEKLSSYRQGHVEIRDLAKVSNGNVRIGSK